MKKHLTFLNVLACFAVVALHTNGVVHQFSYDSYWISANIIENIFYFAVPIFFMIVGVTSLDYREKYTTSQFLKKRFIKTLVPFLAWSIIAMFYQIRVNNFQITSIRSIWNGVMQVQYNNLFWFFMPLFVVYLSIPIFAVIPKNVRKESYRYLLIVSIIFNALLPLLLKILKLSYNDALFIPGGYVMLVILGYYLEHYLNQKYYNYIYVLGILALCIQIIGTQYLSYKIGSVNPLFKGYLGTTTIIYSSAIYLAVKQFSQLKISNRLHTLCQPLAKRSFGIYLMQYFFLDYAIRHHFAVYSIQYRIIAPFIIFALCYLLTYILQKIPIIKHIVP